MAADEIGMEVCLEDMGDFHPQGPGLLNVKVLKVQVSNMKGKPRRIGRSMGKRSDWKKAVVTLRPGDHIEFFEGV